MRTAGGRRPVQHIGTENELLALEDLGRLVEDAVLEQERAACSRRDALPELREVGVSPEEAVVEIENERQETSYPALELDHGIPVDAVLFSGTVAVEPEA